MGNNEQGIFDCALYRQGLLARTRSKIGTGRVTGFVAGRIALGGLVDEAHRHA